MVAALAIGLVGAVVFLLLPGTGSLVISAAGPGNKRIDAVEIFVDGAKQCERSPCRVSELEKGAHTVRVSAAGYEETADTPQKVVPGEDTVVNYELVPASQGTGLRVSAEGSGLKLFVDGKAVGPLPQELTDMSAGEHSIRIAGNDRYEAYEERVFIEPDTMKSIGPVKPKVVKGLAIIEAGDNAAGANVLLVSGRERRPIPKELPIKIDIKTDKRYKLVAEKNGYQAFSRDIEFDDGEAEKTFVIDLERERAQATRPRQGGGTSRPAQPQRPAATGKGKLNINSIPVSAVVLDGVPQGNTPKVGLSVSAGRHTVVFIHPEHGRKVNTVNVRAGQTATAVVRFP